VLLERVVIERLVAVVAVVEAVRSYRSRRGQTTSWTTQIRSGYDCQMMITRLTTARHPLLAASCKQCGKQKVMRLKLAIWASCLNTLGRK
jgi:ribosomal protein L40E